MHCQICDPRSDRFTTSRQQYLALPVGAKYPVKPIVRDPAVKNNRASKKNKQHVGRIFRRMDPATETRESPLLSSQPTPRKLKLKRNQY